MTSRTVTFYFCVTFVVNLISSAMRTRYYVLLPFIVITHRKLSCLLLDKQKKLSDPAVKSGAGGWYVRKKEKHFDDLARPK